jgi:hypothetical protein
MKTAVTIACDVYSILWQSFTKEPNQIVAFSVTSKIFEQASFIRKELRLRVQNKKYQVLRKTDKSGNLYIVVRCIKKVNPRPYFGPNQVRTLRGIKVGKTYVEKPRNKIVTIASKLFHDSNGYWVMVSCGGTEEKISLCDRSVVPYEPYRTWNSQNWLSRTK